MFTPEGRQITVSFNSHLLDDMDIFLGFSLIILTATLVATFGEQIRMRP
jgi:hypothetical protein